MNWITNKVISNSSLHSFSCYQLVGKSNGFGKNAKLRIEWGLLNETEDCYSACWTLIVSRSAHRDAVIHVVIGFNKFQNHSCLTLFTGCIIQGRESDIVCSSHAAHWLFTSSLTLLKRKHFVIHICLVALYSMMPCWIHTALDLLQIIFHFRTRNVHLLQSIGRSKDLFCEPTFYRNLFKKSITARCWHNTTSTKSNPIDIKRQPVRCSSSLAFKWRDWNYGSMSTVRLREDNDVWYQRSSPAY